MAADEQNEFQRCSGCATVTPLKNVRLAEPTMCPGCLNNKKVIAALSSENRALWATVRTTGEQLASIAKRLQL